MSHGQHPATFNPPVTSSADYQARAGHDEAAPAPPEAGPFVRSLSVLSTGQNNAVRSLLIAGADLASVVYGIGASPVHDDVYKLHSDLSDAWAIAFERENPGELARQAAAKAALESVAGEIDRQAGAA